MARTFDGVNDVIEFGLGALNVASPVTCAAIIRKTRVDASGTFMAIFYVAPVAGTPGYGIGINAADNQLAYIRDNSNTRSAAVTITTAESWVFVAIVKTAAAAPRFHKYVYSTNAWTQDTTGVTTDHTTPGVTAIPTIGAYVSLANDYEGDAAVVGSWDRALSDSEIMALPHNLLAWRTAAPKGLWVLDQSVTTQKVPDQSGNGSNENSITGTSIATSSSPGPSTYGGVIIPAGVSGGVSKVATLPWQSFGAASSNVLGEVPTTAAIPRVWEDTAGPTVSDDSSLGVGVGDVWIDITNQAGYWCTSNAVGAAVWKKVTP